MLNPDSSEHDYLAWMICDRHACHTAEIVHPIRDQIRELLGAKKIGEAIALELQVPWLQQVLVEELTTAEDIVYWLRWDAEARKIGTTYPELREQAQKMDKKIGAPDGTPDEKILPSA